MTNVSVLEINRYAIKHNLAFFKSKLNQSTKILVVVKAFSYGSDSVLVAKILQNNNIDYLAVAYVDEGIILRNNGITLPILVLHPQIKNLSLLIEHNLEPNIYSDKVLNEFISLAKKENLNQYPIHLKFNTGLNRLGFQPKNVNKVISLVKEHTQLKIASIFSHLAASEDLSELDFTQNQINSFNNIKLKAEKLLHYRPIYHLLNTSGIINFPTSQFDMVRLGIGLYGLANDENITQKLENVLSLKSIISQINTISKGNSVGYNRAFITNKNIKIATIPIGYADGISRKLGNGIGYILIQNKKVKIVGDVSMGMIMVDVSNINCSEGDEVVIFNSQKMIEEISTKLNTIPYEFITMISQRIRRKVI